MISEKKLNDLPDKAGLAIRRYIRHVRRGKVLRLGLDMGTKNIVLASRSGEKVKFKKEVNGFIEIPKGDGFAKSMLLGQGIPFIEKDDKFIALGEKAEDIAYTFGTYLRRPMERGVVSVGETEAMKIMSSIVKGIIGNINNDAILYYCIPAGALNMETNVVFHQKIVQSIMDSYESNDGFMVKAHPINEARAIVLSQIPDKTGLAVSCGSGMVNISYCLFGMSVYEFSLVGSGDWIDFESARVTGNLVKDSFGHDKVAAVVTKTKENMKLGLEMPSDNLERAIYINYGILIENVAKGIAEGFLMNESKARASKPMPIVVAGGTSSPDGFIELFRDIFSKQNMPFEIGEITRAPDPLYAVAEGCLLAAEWSEI